MPLLPPARTSIALRLLICCALLLVWQGAVPAVSAQQDRPSYQRADALRTRTRNTVYRDRVQAHWFAGQPRFWYQIETGRNQHRFIVVDAAQGSRQEAFDHDKLAAALSESTGRELAPDAIPIREITACLPGQSITFSALAASWKCDLSSYALTKQEETPGDANRSTVNVLPFPRPAMRNGDETNILFQNRTQETIKLYWVNSVENPTFYADVAPGGQHSQHTYSGHVWMAKDPQNRTLGVYEAVDSDGTAVVDGNWRAGQRGQRGQRGGAMGRRGFGPRGGSGDSSPDRKWSARIDDHNVVLRNVETQEEHQLTDNGTESDSYLPRFYWSPDSQRLVVTQQRQGDKREVHIIESSPRDQLQPKLLSYQYDKPGDNIDCPRPRLFDVNKLVEIEVSNALFDSPWSITQLRWESDSSRFTFLFNQRGHQLLRVVAVDATTGVATALIEEKSDTFICYSSKLFYRHLDATNEIIWMSERDGWNHLYLYDAQTGQLKNQITQGPWVVREVQQVDSEQRQIWFTAGGIHSGQDPYHEHYCRINFDGSQLVTLTDGDGTHSIEYSPDRQFLIDTFSRVDLPPVTQLRRTSDGSLICALEEADWSELLKTSWQPPERFVAKGRDGETDIYGVIFRPSTFDPRKRYPVIEQIYAGPHSSHVPKRFAAFHGPQAMAEIGFILVQIDGMGTSNRSKKFHDVCWQNLADAGFPDRILWMQAAAATRPWMDLERVGIYGGSAGGQNAMRALIDHGDFYQAAAADCGCHDNRMDKIWWNEQWMGWPVGPHYAASSNVEQADRLQGHLMLLVGELDRNVDPASTMQVVNALIKADKDFDLIVVPGGGHGSGSGPYGRRRQRDFFVRHLLGTDPAALN